VRDLLLLLYSLGAEKSSPFSVLICKKTIFEDASRINASLPVDRRFFTLWGTFWEFIVDQLRLLLDKACAGHENMAIDEAILKAVGRALAPPTLRFYRWLAPTISLGHFQKYSELAGLAEPFRELAVVRRVTGGGAILHDAELTYSLILPANHPLVINRAPGDLYSLVHRRLITVLSSLSLPVELRRGPKPTSQQRGPFFCFERANPSDVMANGRKIAGSAQRRTLKSLLQHGSLMLDNPLDQPGLATIADFQLPNPPDADALARAWAQQLATDLQLELVVGELNETERELLDPLRAKYSSDQWTKRR